MNSNSSLDSKIQNSEDGFRNLVNKAILQKELTKIYDSANSRIFLVKDTVNAKNFALKKISLKSKNESKMEKELIKIQKEAKILETLKSKKNILKYYSSWSEESITTDSINSKQIFEEEIQNSRTKQKKNRVNNAQRKLTMTNNPADRKAKEIKTNFYILTEFCSENLESFLVKHFGENNSENFDNTEN